MPKTGKFKTSFKNPQQFVDFLEDRLIPDLKESGHEATAHDLMEAVYWLWENSIVDASTLGDDSLDPY